MSNVPYYLAEGAQRAPHGERHARRRHDPRRPLGPVQQRPHGLVRRPLRRASTSSRARRRTTSPRRASAARSPPRRKGSSTRRSSRSKVRRGRATRVLVKLDEGPAKGDPTKFAALKPAFAQGRHDHGGERLVDQRRRQRARPRQREGGQASTSSSRSRASAATPTPRRPPSGSRRRRPRPSTRSTQEARRSRPTRSTSSRSTRPSRSSRWRAPKLCNLDLAEGQRPRRRRGPRPPHRRERRAHPHDARARDEGPRTPSAVWRRCASAAAKRSALVVER